MMNRPPIDELAAKFNGNKYELSILMAKRAKELEKRDIENDPMYNNKKCISAAAEEIYEGKIVANELKD